ncbi:hypothetical protein F4860DRAFT_529974 [Xylaria cubensis]|nr:hypothetical protein F4860DRAFT_529974 [Xylaria cubensis]
MPESLRLNLNNNIGNVQGVHYGDNVHYINPTDNLSLKHIALKIHNAMIRRWIDSETCDWLLQRSDFQLWKNTKAKSSFLWLHGRPGCGKSTLMSRVIQSIYHDSLEVRGSNDICLLYFYVGFGDDKDNDNLFRNMLLTFWEQANNNSAELAINTFDDSFPVQSISEALQKLLTSPQRDIYVFIDALDQLPEDSQYQLIGLLNNLIQKLENRASSSRLFTAISSRDCRRINELRPHTLFWIEVTPESNRSDIETYLMKYLQSSLLKRNPRLRDEAFHKLNKNADGMFLWASLQTSKICGLIAESQVVDALENLIPPQQMQDMYQAYAEEFENIQEPIRRQIAQRAVALLVHSAGSMPREAITVALSLNVDGRLNQNVYQDLTRDPTIATCFCNNLIRINENLGVFEFCHRTIYEFFRAYRPPTYNHRVAELCLSYLSSPEFSEGPRSDARWYDFGSLGPILQENPFLLFASSKWASRLGTVFSSESQEVLPQISHLSILNLLEKLFNQDAAMRGRGNLQLAFQVHLLNEGKIMPDGVCPEHIISYFSLGRLFGNLQERGLLNSAKLDNDGLTSIHWAVQGDTDTENVILTVKKLIQYGANVNAKDKRGHSPLYYAASQGNLRVTELLIENNSQINLTSEDGETALIAACLKHHERVVLCLVEAKADVTIQSIYGTALQAISMVGCCNCAKAILRGYDRSGIVENSGPFGTSLHAASFHGHTDLVKLLCSKHTNVRAKDKTYGSPITAAAMGYNPGLDPSGFVKTIGVLIDHGVEVNDRSGVAGPALRSAAYHGSPEIVRLLLDKGAKVGKAIGPMGTAYEAAEDRGHHDIMEMLKESDPRAAEYSGTHDSRTQDHQTIQRIVFRATVKISSIETINNLVGQFEKFFEKEIKKGNTPFLRGLAKLGTDAFLDVIELATGSHEDTSTLGTRRDKSHRSRLWHILRYFHCIGRDGADIALECNTFPRPLRTASSSFQDSLGEYFPTVLDRITQAAVKILEDAIESKDKTVIHLIAGTWVEALNKLISYPNFGQSMLEKVIQRRAAEVKEYLTKGKSDNGDAEDSEGLKKATAIASVGIELLIVAVGRGSTFRKLSIVISKLWIKALDDMEDLGKSGDDPILVFIRIFTERLARTIMIQDQTNAEICAQAGIEFLRSAALLQKTKLSDRFNEELVPLWRLAFENNMEYMAKELIERRRKEYHTCLESAKHDEAVGLVAVSIGALRVAIKYRNGPLISILQPFLESVCQLTRDGHDYDTSIEPATSPFKGIQAQYLGVIITAGVNLFETAERSQAGLLNTLALRIIEIAGALLTEGDQTFTTIISKRIEVVGQTIDPLERERLSIQILRMVLLFLDVALCDRETHSTVLSVLGKVAWEELGAIVPNFLERHELVRYGRAARYLRSELHDISV